MTEPLKTNVKFVRIRSNSGKDISGTARNRRSTLLLLRLYSGRFGIIRIQM